MASEVEPGELAFVRLSDRNIEAPHISLVIPKHDKPSPAARGRLNLLTRDLSVAAGGSLEA